MRTLWARMFASLSVAGLVATSAAGAQVRLPDFGDSSETVLNAATDRALGQAFMRQIRASMTIIDDPEVEDYVQTLGYRLVSVSDSQRLGFNFFVVQDGGINAFAAPGGWVGLNSGLIAASDSESELASVVAHEIAHVTQRHIARRFEASERSNMAALAGLLAAIAIGTQNSEAGQAAAAAVIGSQAQSSLNYSRDFEKEADRVGMQLLDGAGFDPAAMATFFEKLQGAGRYYRRPPEFLSTHPVTTSRIAEARSRLASFGFRQHADSRRFRMVRAKLLVLTAEDLPALANTFREQIQKNAPASSPGLRYGLALTHRRMGKLEEAYAELEALNREVPDDVAVRMALASTAMQSGREREALAMMEDAASLRPDNRLVARAYVGALLRSRQHDKAMRVLEEYRRTGAPDAELLRYRAQVLDAVGRTAESQATLAEHYYRRGQLDAAIQQLVLASRHPDNNFYNASRIEARLEELRAEQAALARR